MIFLISLTLLINSWIINTVCFKLSLNIIFSFIVIEFFENLICRTWDKISNIWSTWKRKNIHINVCLVLCWSARKCHSALLKKKGNRTNYTLRFLRKRRRTFNSLLLQLSIYHRNFAEIALL